MTIFYYKDNTVKDYHDCSLDIIKIEWENGCVEYYQDGKLHRLDKDIDGNLLPALIHSDGSKEYWIDGHRRLREAGPSIEWADGTVEYKDEI